MFPANPDPMPKLSQEVGRELRSDICSTHTSSTTADKAMQTHHPCGRDNDIFRCATNKTICVGPGLDEGSNRDTMERFIKDVSFHEDRYISREGIEAAFLASKFIIEVQHVQLCIPEAWSHEDLSDPLPSPLETKGLNQTDTQKQQTHIRAKDSMSLLCPFHHLQAEVRRGSPPGYVLLESTRASP